MDQMTDLDCLLKLAGLIADDPYAGGFKTVSEYREGLLCTVVSLLGYTPEFLAKRRAAQIRRRGVPSGGRCRDDAYRGPRR